MIQPLNSLQVLRGIAAWLVVYHHYMQGFHNFRGSTVIGHFFTITGKFGIDLFSVISGFIMFYTLQLRHHTAREFLLRRLIRIVPLYWIMTLAFIPVLYTFPSPISKLTDWSIPTLALSLLFVPHENSSGQGAFPLLTVGWTLNFEMFFYVWLSLMLAAFRRRWFVTCAVSMLLLPLVWPPSWPFSDILGSSLLDEFVLGMFIGYLYLRERRLRKAGGLILGSILFLSAVILYTQVDCCSRLPLLSRFGNISNCLAAAMFVSAALALDQYVSRVAWLRLWRRLGDMSYSTYLVHPISLVVCVYILGEPKSSVGELATIGIYTALTLALSQLGYRWVETGHAVERLKQKLLAPRTQPDAETVAS